MIDILKTNPYRILGIYSNSPTKERVANGNRMKAFLKVGKQVSFPLDLPLLLPPINRTTENVEESDAKLTLPNEQLRYAQFWLIKSTPMDDIAMNHLIAGNIDNAILIWQKKENASSLQNCIVCSLIRDDFSKALMYASKLYSIYSAEFVNLVLGGNHAVTTDNLPYAFLDELYDAVGAQKLMPYIQDKEWKHYIGDKTVKPLIAALQSAINVAKASKGKGIKARLVAGTNLMNGTKEQLAQLKTLFPAKDLQYQMIADKLGLEILQCSIDYYNASEAADAAHKAMKLQAYALSIVVGQMAKDRCKENVDILQNIIDNLPPKEIFAEDKAIKEELRKFCQQPNKICHAVVLLNNTKPHLQAIKQKLGATNDCYLKISTQVVGNALHNIIEEVNQVQQYFSNVIETIKERGLDPHLLSGLDLDISPTKILENKVKPVVREAWKATILMDGFDMEPDFKSNRYNSNRNSLKGICNQLGISTYASVTRSTSPKIKPPQPIPPTDNSSSSNVNNPNRNTNDSNDYGCIICIVCLVIGSLIGRAIAGAGGAVFGALAGLAFYGKIAN